MNLIPDISKFIGDCNLRVNKDQIVAVKKDIVDRLDDNNYTVNIIIWVSGNPASFTFSFKLLDAQYSGRYFRKLVKYSTDDVIVHNKLYTNNLMDYFNLLSDLGIEDSCFMKRKN